MNNNPFSSQKRSFQIRKAIEADFPQIMSLIREFSQFQKTPERVTITCEQMVKDKDVFQCLVAEAGENEIIGFATFFPAYYSWTGKAVYLDDLYVTGSYRQQGIGKELLNTVIKLAKDENCYKVKWQVSKWNTHAIDFYKKIGAEIDDMEINCDFIIQKLSCPEIG